MIASPHNTNRATPAVGRGSGPEWVHACTATEAGRGELYRVYPLTLRFLPALLHSRDHILTFMRRHSRNRVPEPTRASDVRRPV